MLLASLALVTAHLPAVHARPASEVQAAATPCNTDPLKSIGCVAQRHAPTPRAAARVPIACNPDPLKGAACHAHVAQARAEPRSDAARSEELASAE